MQERIVKRYSACFKQQVVSEIEAGRLASMAQAQQHYGISGATTIKRWLTQYGKNHLRAKVVRVEQADEADRTREIKRRVSDLERALGATQAQNLLNAAYLELACEQLGQEVAAFKKKSDGKRSTGRSSEGGARVKMLCEMTGMTRQNVYKQRRLREQWTVDERLVLELIQRERSRQPRLGGRKLMRLIGGDMKAAGVSLGRDRFFTLVRHHDLLIRQKRRIARTTDSRHRFAVYPNLARTLELSGPHQLWVSDITYLRTLEGFLYLCLVMDAFSRAIVGWDCSDSLEMEGALRALSLAVEQLPVGAPVMHHSDRGVQYCCGAYIQRLLEAQATISMTEANHCYENSQAERLNGTLKREYSLGDTFASKALAPPMASEAVALYNHHRPHEALDYRMPMQVHAAAWGQVREEVTM